jgi:hypothetical protein
MRMVATHYHVQEDNVIGFDMNEATSITNTGAEKHRRENVI